MRKSPCANEDYVRGEARDVEPLLKALESAGKEPRLRAEIYTALGRIGEARSVPTLVRALENFKNGDEDTVSPAQQATVRSFLTLEKAVAKLTECGEPVVR